MEDGRWVTINGAHVFIKEGQHPMDAFIRQQAAKNKNKDNKEENAEKSVLLREEKEMLQRKIHDGNLSNEEYNNIKQRLEEIKEERKKLNENLTEEDLRNARHRIENKRYEEKRPKIDKVEEDKKYNKLIKEYDKDLDEEIKEGLSSIERFEGEYGINSQSVNEVLTKTMQKIESMHDSGEISDYVYEKYLDNINNKISDNMSMKGYEIYGHNGEIYYSMIPKAKANYNSILDELEKRGLNYEISKSWDKGELPSIYVKNENDQIFRIANHYNANNPEYLQSSFERNVIYSTKDYINYKDTIIKDLEKWLKERK